MKKFVGESVRKLQVRLYTHKGKCLLQNIFITLVEAFHNTISVDDTVDSPSEVHPEQVHAFLYKKGIKHSTIFLTFTEAVLT